MLCRLSYAGNQGGTNMTFANGNFNRFSLRHALDLGAEMPEFLIDALVAAVNVVDTVDFGFAIGCKTSKHEASTRAQITRHHGRAAQPLHAFDNGAVAFERNVGAEPRHFADVH